MQTAELIHTCDVLLPVAVECLGGTFETRIGGVGALLLVPALDRPRLEDSPVVAPPPFVVLVGDVDWTNSFHDQLDITTGSPWGQMHSWHPEDRSMGSPDLQRLGIRFAAESEELVATYERVVEDLVGWWESFKEWIEILTAVDVTTHNLGTIFAPAAAWTRPAEGEPRQALRHHGPITISPPADKKRIPRSGLARAASLAGLEEPGLEWRLIRAARQRLWQRQYRASVLDAGSAAELALTKLIVRSLGDISISAKSALIDKYRTLGNRGDLFRRLGGEIPDEFWSGLVRPRNLATHEGAQLSLQQSEEAERIASMIVERATPLP